jgi:hypothetical protein
MNLPKDKRTQVMLVVAAGVVICAGLWFGVIQSRQRILQGSGARLKKAEEQLERAQSKVKNAGVTEGELETLLKTLEGMESQMPKASDDLFAKSYVMLDKAKAGHDVEIREVTRPEKKEGEKKKEVGLFMDFPYDASVFSVSGAAYYHDFGQFLADFENEHPYCRVQNVTLGTAQEAAPEGAAARLPKEKLTFRMDVVAPIKPGP